MHVALGDLRVPPAVHVPAEPDVIFEHEVGRIHATDPARQRVELLAADTPHRARGGIDDDHRGDARTAPANRRAAERAKVLRISVGVELQRRFENRLHAVTQIHMAFEILVQKSRRNIAQGSPLAQFGRRVGIFSADNNHTRTRTPREPLNRTLEVQRRDPNELSIFRLNVIGTGPIVRTKLADDFVARKIGRLFGHNPNVREFSARRRAARHGRVCEVA